MESAPHFVMTADLIDDLINRASSEPAATEAVVTDLLRRNDDDTARLLLALGIAQRNLGRATESVATLRRASGLVDSSDGETHARVLISLGGSLGFTGEFDEALQVLDEVIETSDGLPAARAEHQRATLLQRAGDPEGARAGYRRALAVLRRHDDHTFEGHVHTNLSILLTYEGRVGEALDELDDAMRCYRSAEQHKWEAITIHNQGWTYGCIGELPTALRLFDKAEERFAALAIPEAPRRAIRAEALLRAGLVGQARAELTVALDELAELGLETDRAETLVLASRAARLAGDDPAAVALAAEAAQALGGQDRQGWASLADLAAVEAGGRRFTADEALGLMQALTEAGQTAAGFQALIASAGVAIDDGDLETAGRLLSRLPAIERTPTERLSEALQRSRLAALRGDREQALAVCEEAYTELDTLLHRLASIDLIAGAAAQLSRLIQLAKTTVLGTSPTNGDVEHYLVWCDRRRRVGARRWPINLDEEARSAIDRFRGLDAALQDDPGNDELRAALGDAQRRLEARDWSHAAPRSSATTTTSESPSPTIAEDGLVIDVSICGDRLVRVVLGPEGPVEVGVERYDAALVTALDRLGRLAVTAPPEGRPRLQSRLDELAGEGQRLLVGEDEGVHRAIADSDSPIRLLVDGELAGLPIGRTPPLSDVAHVIVPWRTSAPAPPTSAATTASGAQPVLIVGPDLSSTAMEVHHLQRFGPWRVMEPECSMAEIVEAISGAPIVHIAAHGGVEVENPMFSWLQLGAGKLYLHDLTRVMSPPTGVVLSACLAARSQDHDGAGSLSFAEAFLGLGCRWLVGAVSSIPDDAEIAHLVTDLYDHLWRGDDAADALHAARRLAIRRGDRRAAAAFRCYRL
ncbi:MAG: CHAT domain-containing protein [Actinomycetota bacterium]